MSSSSVGLPDEAAPVRRDRRAGREASEQRRAELAGEASAAAASVQPTVPSVEADPPAAAFFDVDNTMMMGSSMFHISRGLAARKFFTTRDLGRFAWRQAVFRIGGSEPAGYLAEARKAALAFAAGWHVDEVVRLGEEIYDEIMAERIWPGTRALAAGPPRPAASGSGWSRRRRSSWPRSSPNGSASPAPSAASPSTRTASTPAS